MSVSTLVAVSALVDALSLMSELTQQLQHASMVIMRAQSEGRDLTDEEWAKLDTTLSASRSRLAEAIARREAGGNLSGK